MERLQITTGTYINVCKGGEDIYLIINEANDIDDAKILEATTYLEDALEYRLKETRWDLITAKLESIFPYGVHIVRRR